MVHDDLEQKLGRYRLVKGTSFKGHNGLRSIESSLGGYKDFTRIGIGIDRPLERDPAAVAKYVLSDFSNDEMAILNS